MGDEVMNWKRGINGPVPSASRRYRVWTVLRVLLPIHVPSACGSEFPNPMGRLRPFRPVLELTADIDRVLVISFAGW